MGSTFLGLEIGKRTLSFHQSALEVTGHNMANADNKAYSRQRVNPTTLPPLTDPSLAREERPGQIGQGVQIESITRARDVYLDQRITDKVSKASYWSENEKLLKEVEDIHHALGDVNLQSRMDDFWKSWQNLSQFPTEGAVREELVQNAKALTRGINEHFDNLYNHRLQLDEKVINTVKTINDIGTMVAYLNTRILQAKAMGDNPNDLMDRRDMLVEELSEHINVKMTHRDNDEIMLFVGGKVLVQGQKVTPLELEADPNKEGMHDILWTPEGDSFELTAGKLKALLENRDIHIPGQIERLDSMARSLIERVNEFHRSGFDAAKRSGGDFFETRFAGTDPRGVFDSRGDGVPDRSYVSRVSGTQKINADHVIAENGVLRFRSGNDIEEISYSADMKISELIEKINLESRNVNAHINPQGSLVLRANNELVSDPENYLGRRAFTIEHIEDSGNFLTGVAGLLNQSGPAGAFDIENPDASNALTGGSASLVRTPDKHPSGWIRVSEEIAENPQRIAAAEGVGYDGNNRVSSGIRDNGVALNISSLRTERIFINDKQTFNDFYASMTEDIAGKAYAASRESENFAADVNRLKDLRQSISGVNIDEEVSKMLAYQHGYQAGARIISVMDNLLDTLINRTGV